MSPPPTNLDPKLRHPNDLKIPMPPPALLSRSTNEQVFHRDDYAQPLTPTRGAPPGSFYPDFVTPQQTPQGSPSKSHMPPGAYNLPNAFDNAMKLSEQSYFTGSPTPGSPSKIPTAAGRPHPPTSPGRQQMYHRSGPPSPQADTTTIEYPQYESAAVAGAPVPGSPTRKSNKENTPPGGAMPRSNALKKENLGGASGFFSQAAQSRQEPYRTREDVQSAPRYMQRGLSPEDWEKLQQPSVKRLANVTQLCTFSDVVERIS